MCGQLCIMQWTKQMRKEPISKRQTVCFPVYLVENSTLSDFICHDICSNVSESCKGNCVMKHNIYCT